MASDEDIRSGSVNNAHSDGNPDFHRVVLLKHGIDDTCFGKARDPDCGMETHSLTTCVGRDIYKWTIPDPPFFFKGMVPPVDLHPSFIV
jgi:hypothetical protein